MTSEQDEIVQTPQAGGNHRVEAGKLALGYFSGAIRWS